MTDPTTLAERVKVLKAIASVPRLAMLEALDAGDLSVGELAAVAGSDISTVSRHLSVLRDAGIVSSERSGSLVICHLVTPCVLEFCRCVEVRVRGGAAGEPDEYRCRPSRERRFP